MPECRGNGRYSSYFVRLIWGVGKGRLDRNGRAQSVVFRQKSDDGRGGNGFFVCAARVVGLAEALVSIL